jgi:hypothetical protein
MGGLRAAHFLCVPSMFDSWEVQVLFHSPMEAKRLNMICGSGDGTILPNRWEKNPIRMSSGRVDFPPQRIKNW